MLDLALILGGLILIGADFLVFTKIDGRSNEFPIITKAFTVCNIGLAVIMLGIIIRFNLWC